MKEKEAYLMAQLHKSLEEKRALEMAEEAKKTQFN